MWWRIRSERPSRKTIRTCYWRPVSSVSLHALPNLHPLLIGQFLHLPGSSRREPVRLAMRKPSPLWSRVLRSRLLRRLLAKVWMILAPLFILYIHRTFLHKGWASTTSASLERKLFFWEREVEQGEKCINQLSVEVKQKGNDSCSCIRQVNKQRLIYRKGFWFEFVEAIYELIQ